MIAATIRLAVEEDANKDDLFDEVVETEDQPALEGTGSSEVVEEIIESSIISNDKLLTSEIPFGGK